VHAPPMVREKQLRLIYSLLRPALELAARFNVPIRTLSDLLRLAYYETLAKQGLEQQEIAARFGQTPRHMRTLAQRLKGDFFAAEHEIGLVRAVEEAVALGARTEGAIRRGVRPASSEDVAHALETLLAENRIETDETGEFRTGTRYAVLASEQFTHRVDALNHFLDAALRAIVQRLVYDERQTAMIKTVSFSADPAELRTFVDRLEGDLRREVSRLDESATFRGIVDRFTFALTLARAEPPSGP
jgi:hypothetical protein